MNDWDIYVRCIYLPLKVEGITTPNNDGTFSIYINSNICEQRQQIILKHELSHIKNNHFYDCEPVVYNECNANVAV